ncbi:hypothetical protein PsSCT_05310 [Pseudomonas sp. SCT]
MAKASAVARPTPAVAPQITAVGSGIGNPLVDAWESRVVARKLWLDDPRKPWRVPTPAPGLFPTELLGYRPMANGGYVFGLGWLAG